MAAFENPRESGFDPELVKTALMSREQFCSKPRKLILGIDMGIADIGICLMDELNHEIVLMATHLFDCPRNPKDQTSLASTRRQARSQRRNIARRAARKKHIRTILMAHGVIPEGTTADWFSVRRGEQDNIQLRVKGLSEVLTDRELAKLKEDNFTNNIDSFISRNLNDTRYMSKDVAKWLADCLPFPKDGRRHVFCVSGAATGLMRRVWRIGILDENGKKDREDDRHHAVDAAVIAACTPSVVKSIALISEEHATHRDADRLLNRSLPYPEFKDQVDAWIPCIVPTYSPTRTATGALFKENAYSYKGIDERGKDLIKKKKGEAGPCTTAWNDGKGTARAYDGQYGLLAVYNESTSRWLLDPLYYIDVQRRKAEKPFIRKFSKDLSIDYWEKIPLTGDEQTLFLKPGDVLAQDGLVGRLHSYDISVNTVKMYYARGEISFQKTGPLATERFPTLSKWNDGLKIMQEDCLGLCWLKFLTDRTSSC